MVQVVKFPTGSRFVCILTPDLENQSNPDLKSPVIPISFKRRVCNVKKINTYIKSLLNYNIFDLSEFNALVYNSLHVAQMMGFWSETVENTGKRRKL